MRRGDVQVSSGGTRVTFLRSSGPDDTVNALWRLDVASRTEVVVADPRRLLDDADADLPPEDTPRERARESAGGIVAYATDAPGRIAVAALNGRLVVADVEAATAELVDVPGPVFDPRPDPTGTASCGSGDVSSGWLSSTILRRAMPCGRGGPSHQLGSGRVHRSRGDEPSTRLLVGA